MAPLKAKGVRRWLAKALKNNYYDDLEFDFQDHILKHTGITKLLTSTKEGPFFFLPDDRVMGRVLATDGVWEEEETRIFKSIVKPGDLCIDVGANIGWYTVVLSRLVDPEGIVLAFEPEPRNYRLLQENLSLNGIDRGARCLQLALLDSERPLELLLSDYNLGDHHVHLEGASPAREQNRRAIQITAARLDTVLDQQGLSDKPICLLKIDTQGAEVGVLRGAKDALLRTRYLFVEYSPSEIRNRGFTTEEFVDLISGAFESFGRVQELKGQPSDFLPIAQLRSDLQRPLNQFGYADYVFRK